MACYLISREGVPGIHESFLKREIIEPDPIVRSIARMPHLERFVTVWGRLFSLPGALGPAFRSRTLECCKAPAERPINLTEIDAIEVGLPKEAVMLPHIACAAVETRDRRHRGQLLRSPGDGARQFVNLYIRDAGMLEEILYNEEQPTEARAAAMVLRAISRDDPVDWLLQGRASPKRLYGLGHGSWFVGGMCLALSRDIALGRREPLEIVNELFEISRLDYAVTMLTASIISEWREYARAPVKAADRPELWR